MAVAGPPQQDNKKGKINAANVRVVIVCGLQTTILMQRGSILAVGGIGNDDFSSLADNAITKTRSVFQSLSPVGPS
jgi:hypothetical protein